VRLCKAQRYRYPTTTSTSSRPPAAETQSARLRLIATDGVFSMDGNIARVKDICDLAEKYGALVHVDDSHATGFVGPTGRGSHEHRGASAASTSSPRRWARRSAGPPAASRPRARRSSSCCATARAPTCSATPCRRRSSPPLAVMDLLTGTDQLLADLNANTRASATA
jgi:glycine C-acetyltransferase